MADCADLSDDKIDAVVAAGWKRSENLVRNPSLTPIIFEVDDDRWGVCHWCESPIIPGRLFCEKDPNDSGMCCSQSWDHDHKRRKDCGL